MSMKADAWKDYQKAAKYANKRQKKVLTNMRSEKKE